ncbi:MAG: hypothetical protein HY943_20970 [Gammaproteobacteria bacterium]|nr:hypothetical protein [Gammaproteobacteria bacterium]
MGYTTDQQVAIRAAVTAISSSELFRSSLRQRRFLEFVVEEALHGRGERLNGYTVGIEAFDRPADFDPTVDAIVRVEAGRLRSKLVEYYSRAEHRDEVEISLPRGRYSPEFKFPAAGDGPARVSTSAGARSAVDHGTALAVLPFENLNGEPEDDYFCAGLADDLIAALSKLNGFTVLSRYATARFEASHDDPVATSSALAVDYLLTGSVRHVQQRIRISLQLVDGASGHVLWSQKYDNTLERVFDVQDQVVAEVAGFLKDALTPNEHAQLARRGTRNLAAFQEYMRGVYDASQPDPSAEWIERGAAHFARAYELDPGYGEALARLSRLEMARLGNWLGEPDAIMIRLRRHAEDAAQLTPDSALAQSALASARVLEQRYDEAIDAASKASSLEPGSAEIAAVAGLALAQSGRLAEGHELVERALRAEKLLNPIHAFAAGMVYFAAADYIRGRDVLIDVLQRVPRLLVANALLAAHCAMLGEDARAIEQFRYVETNGPSNLDDARLWRGLVNWRDPEISDRLSRALANARVVAGIASAQRARRERRSPRP